jgi:hypothetical protein
MGRDDSEMLLHLRMGLTKLGGNCAEVLILVLRSVEETLSTVFSRS